MSMNSKNLSVLAYSNGFTFWHYKTEDAKDAVVAANYFNDVANIFNVGDLIVASMDIAGTMTTGMFVVTSIASGVVSISSIIPSASV